MLNVQQVQEMRLQVRERSALGRVWVQEATLRWLRPVFAMQVHVPAG